MHVGESKGAHFPTHCSQTTLAVTLVNLWAKLNLSGVNMSVETLLLCRKPHVTFGSMQLGGLCGDSRDHM